MPASLTFITGNPQKAEQLSWHLDYPISHLKLDLTEIQSLDAVEVVTHKAREAYQKIQQPVLVEDISVRFLALGKLPGTLIKFFLLELSLDEICRLLDPYSSRAATVEVNFAYNDGTEVRIFNAAIDGEISNHPRGQTGLGMDSIFIPKGSIQTWGEMDKAELTETSIRRVALRKLQIFLSTLSE